MERDRIFWVEHCNKEYNDLIGKKCANLGEMSQLGLRVPSGFALCLEAYDEFMELSGAGKQIREYLEKAGELESIEDFNRISADLRAIIHSTEIPSPLEDLILNHYRDLCDKCGKADIPVATRSAGAKSHPGQYETNLNVRGESDLLKNIKKVWSSTFNPRSLNARKQRNLPLESDPIGVAVLQMVNARAAGVLFTADPNTGDTSKIIIEANWGLGESVVGGEAMPDVFVVKKQSLDILEKKLGTKNKCIVLKDKGVTELKTPSDKCSLFCLSDQEVIELAKLGKILEEHFGGPQDAEWAVDEDQNFPENMTLLQARPAVIAPKKDPVDQVVDMMLTRFSG